ncbi:hypothetical protein F5890DRAFT_1536996 [Lentinula detonsa]|uniref:Homeobox domain-containing protein n=1 Tax=Lentinula detonsa TaxID=2804962 RepID=A0AA38UPH7_9AGAR|nr:hypothetical protein F5890DRAFT_1536996 [Lentinula detonsa]
MLANEELDDRLVLTVEHFLSGLHNSTLDDLLSNWDNLDKDIMNSHSTGLLNSSTSSLAMCVSDCMSLLCDTFINLKVTTDGIATQLGHDLQASLSDAEPTPSRSPSPSLTTTTTTFPLTLPPYIPPSYTWLLSNLHNPYPTPQTRDEIASSTNTDRRLIDAWFVDVRRRIGWTRLVDSNRSSHKAKSTSKLRSSSPTSTCATGMVKYKTRKELISASSQFFLPQSSAGATNSLSSLEIQTFSSLAETARGLYKDKLHPTQSAVHLPNQSQDTKRRTRKHTRATSIKHESDSESHSDEDAFQSHINKHSRLSRSISPADSLSSSLPSATPSPFPTTPTTPTFPSSSSSTLKRKRAVSSFEESLSPSLSSFSTEPTSPATKRLRTALNSAGISRSVSDPTPVPQAALTFDGFPAPVLHSWFTPDQACGEGDGGLNFPEEWVDPFWVDPDPIVRSTVTDQSSLVSGHGMVPPPIQPYPLEINVVDLNIYSSSSSSYDRSSRSASTSSPSTPALSASGTLTDEDEDEDDNDSLFGGDDEEAHEGDITATKTKEDVGVGEVGGTGKPLPEPTRTTRTMTTTNMITPADILDQFNLSSLSPSSLNPPINPFTLSSLPELIFNLDALPNQDQTGTNPNTHANASANGNGNGKADGNADGDLNVNVNFDFNLGLDSGLGLDLGLESGLDSNFGFGFGEGFGSAFASGVGSYPQIQTQTQYQNQNHTQYPTHTQYPNQTQYPNPHQTQYPNQNQNQNQSRLGSEFGPGFGLGLPHLERDTPDTSFRTGGVAGSSGSFENPGNTFESSGSSGSSSGFGNLGSFGSFGSFEDLDVFFQGSQVPQYGNTNGGPSPPGLGASPSASVPWAGPTPTRETFGVGVGVGVGV